MSFSNFELNTKYQSYLISIHYLSIIADLHFQSNLIDCFFFNFQMSPTFLERPPPQKDKHQTITE